MRTRQPAQSRRRPAATGGAGSGALFSAEAGIGFKSSSSSADGSSTVSRGSTIQGGGNVNLTSTSGDIHVVQGNLSAGNTLALDSAGDILLEAGKAHLQDKSKSNNAGAEVGVGVSVGAQTGVYVYAEASVGSSKSNSDSSTWQNTTLAGKNISLKAEGDTTLRGATATADRIDVKTGGTLAIESLQDVAESMSKDSQVGGRVQVSLGTAWDASGYASASKANGSYKGVGQQSGLFAGDGGYHVDAGHVNLVGGAIASTNAANSELTAQTLIFTDLKNEMDYRASSASISGGFGAGGEKPTDADGKPLATPNAAGQFKDIGSNVANGKYGQADGSNFSGGVPMTTSGSDSSTTYATLTEGNITIGGKRVTAAELGVNTDASKAHEAISSLPDLRKLMQEQQAMSSAAGTVVSTSKQVAGDVFAYKSEQAKQAFEKDLKNSNPAEWVNYSKLDDNGKTAYLKVASPAYRDALKWGTGGEYSRALDAVAAAVVGGISGQAGGQVSANALAPYAAAFIGSQFDPNHGENPNATLQLVSHAILGALLAEANGAPAGNGAGAAVGGELAAKFLTDMLYGSDPANLDEQQKQTVLALSQAVGALAGGIGGNGVVGASLGATLAGNSVENNRMLTDTELARIKELSNGDVARELELTAAACALVKCSAGFVEGSDERAQWAAVEALGSSAEALEDRNWLKAQVLPGYLYTAGSGMLTEELLFQYTFGNYMSDLSSRNQLGTRTLGGIQALGGSIQAAGGVLLLPTCETVIGCVAAGYLLGTGYDNAVSGVSTLSSGRPTATFGAQLLQSDRISPEVAELLYAMTQVGAAASTIPGKLGTVTTASNLPDPRLSYTNAPFTTHGLDVTADVMKTAEAQALVNEYLKSGATPALAQEYAKVALASGKALPQVIPVGPGYELVKLVPKNAYSTTGSDPIIAYSPFFVTKDEYLKLSRMTASEASEYLGLPAQQGIRGAHLGFDAYSMTPKPGQSPIVFKSEVAPISQGQYSAAGRGEQVIVPNRGLWTDPNGSKIGEIRGAL